MNKIYRVFQKDLNVKNTFPWGIPRYHWSNMAYNTFEHVSSLYFEPTNETLPHRWIGRAVNNDQHLLLWPPRSPDLTPCDFFPYGDTLKTMPTNHHSPPPKCAWTARSHSSCGVNRWWEHVEARLAGVRLSYWHLQSNEGRSHWAFVSWFLLVNKLGHLHYLCVKLYLILTIIK